MDGFHQQSPGSMDVFHQESDAIRTLLLVIVAALRRSDTISSGELKEVFSVAGDLVRARWGPHSVADIVMNGCWEDVIEVLSELDGSGPDPARYGTPTPTPSGDR